MARTRALSGLRVLARVLITGLTVLLIALVAMVDSHPSPAQLRDLATTTAQRVGLHDAVIKNSTESTGAFLACQDWADDMCQDTAADRRELSPGQDTRSSFGWQDSDGLFVAAGCVMQISDDRRAERIVGPRWFKVVGLLGLEQVLTYTCDH